MKLKRFCKSNETINRTKWKPTDWENIFTNPTSDRWLISKIYKKTQDANYQKPNKPT